MQLNRFRLLLAEISLYQQMEAQKALVYLFSSPSGGDQFISKSFT